MWGGGGGRIPPVWGVKNYVGDPYRIQNINHQALNATWLYIMSSGIHPHSFKGTPTFYRLMQVA